MPLKELFPLRELICGHLTALFSQSSGVSEFPDYGSRHSYSLLGNEKLVDDFVKSIFIISLFCQLSIGLWFNLYRLQL